MSEQLRSAARLSAPDACRSADCAVQIVKQRDLRIFRALMLFSDGLLPATAVAPSTDWTARTA